MTKKYEKMKEQLMELISRYAAKENKLNVELEKVSEEMEDIMENIDGLTFDIEGIVDKDKKVKKAKENIEYQKNEHLGILGTVAVIILLLGISSLIFKMPILTVLNLVITEEFFNVLVCGLSYILKTKKDKEVIENSKNINDSLRELPKLSSKKLNEEAILSEKASLKEDLETQLQKVGEDIDLFEYVYDLLFNGKVVEPKDEKLYDHVYGNVMSLIREKNKEINGE